MKKTGAIVLVLLLSVVYSFSQTNLKETNQFQQMIENRQFKFVAHSLMPLTGSTVHLTSIYDLKVDSLNVEAWLPFYGRAYQHDYGSAGGIKFNEKANTLEIEVTEEKQIYKVKIEVKTKNDSYLIFIHAGGGGYASMSINSNRRQSVSYYGVIEALDQ